MHILHMLRYFEKMFSCGLEISFSIDAKAYLWLTLWPRAFGYKSVCVKVVN